MWEAAGRWINLEGRAERAGCRATSSACWPRLPQTHSCGRAPPPSFPLPGCWRRTLQYPQLGPLARLPERVYSPPSQPGAHRHGPRPPWHGRGSWCQSGQGKGLWDTDAVMPAAGARSSPWRGQWASESSGAPGGCSPEPSHPLGSPASQGGCRSACQAASDCSPASRSMCWELPGHAWLGDHYGALTTFRSVPAQV